MTESQTLVSWNLDTPGTFNTGLAITGLMPNEQIRGIDFRPATGELFAIGSFSNLYTLNTSTGEATAVGGGSFTPSLNGSRFGFDFNPTIDRIRVVSDTNQNLVLNPNDGTSSQMTPVFYAAGDVNEGQNPNIVGSSYTNSFAGATTTQLYGIDAGLNVLVTQANNAGTLETVGPLGVDITDMVGFDIDGSTNIGYAALQDANFSRSSFWSIDLSTGQATYIGDIGGGARIVAMSIIPTPGTAAVLALPLFAAARRRR
ncbi:MAG: DUF4394 domain-containing protein [Phycisphaerales bacterium]